MHWVVDENLNIIVKEGAGDLNSDSCELDTIEGNN